MRDVEKIDTLTVRETVARSRMDGIGVSEYSLREMLRKKCFPYHTIGEGKNPRVLIYYPNFVDFITGYRNGDPKRGDIREKEERN